jgi:hypothetical protein
MKTLINIMLALLIAGIGSLSAQVMPVPPEPPAPPSTTVSTTSSNYRISVNSSDSSTGENISLTISNDDDEYSLKANFPKLTGPKLLAYFMENMGSKNLSRKGSRTNWIANGNGDEVYKISLGEKRLTMQIDKEVASNVLVDKFEQMGSDVREIVTGDSAEKIEVKRLEREADRLRRDAERMQREAERLERQAKQSAERRERDEAREGRDLDRVRSDAARVQREAERVREEAEKAGRMSASSGGMDSSVREVLRKENTFFDETKAQNNNGWTWPAFQQALILSLEEEELVGEDNELIFVRDQSGMYVNGEKLNRAEEIKYNGLFKKHGLSKAGYFTFYKLYDHIVVINSNARILDFFKALKAQGTIDSIKKPVKLAINGDTMSLDDNPLPANKVKEINKLLSAHNIIPVPGKVIQLLKGGNYKLGYSLGKRTHIGTWGMDN